MTNTISNDGWTPSRILGTGGFGIVELWVHIQSGRKLAIKKCKWDYSQLTAIQQRRWTKEVEIMKYLKHPNIVRCGTFNLPNADKRVPILCMEYCKKGDLRKILNQPENCCGINEIEAIKIMSQISSAVEYLHSQQITHRDLKPENIVLQEESNVISYKLIDLGYAKELGEASISASFVGTLNYVAPEIFWKETYSCSVDYWSLGILFYELVTGTRPFLPTMQYTVKWMKHIQNKSYDDIHAYESEGKVIFGKDIQDPTHLSNCLRSKMIEWFRLVLQWDPHRRGKMFDESGILHLMVFKMLQRALSNKIVYVFCVPFYKINIYEIDNATTIKDLQLLIEKDTNIAIEHQILTDYNGIVLIENTMPFMLQTNHHILFLLRNGSCFIENIPTLNISAVIGKMLTQSKDELDYEVLKDYYRHTIYFMKKEVDIFQWYIFALSISVDLLYQKIYTFNMNMDEILKSTKTLMNQVHTIRTKHTHLMNKNMDKMEALQTYFKKVDELINIADGIKIKFISLKGDNDRLRDKARNIHCIRDLSQLYDKICKAYLEFKKQTSRKTAKPLNMVKLMFAFLDKREMQLRNENLIDVTRQIDKLQDELLKLEKIFNSVIIMTKSYWKEYQQILIVFDQQMQFDDSVASQQASNHQFLDISNIELNKIIQLEDSVIHDDSIMHYKMDNLIAEIESIMR